MKQIPWLKPQLVTTDGRLSVSLVPLVKREFFLPPIAKCLLIGVVLFWGFLYIIVGALPYSPKHLEGIWFYINEMKLKYIIGHNVF